jgi:hypothetical protein
LIDQAPAPGARLFQARIGEDDLLSHHRDGGDFGGISGADQAMIDGLKVGTEALAAHGFFSPPSLGMSISSVKAVIAPMPIDEFETVRRLAFAKRQAALVRPALHRSAILDPRAARVCGAETLRGFRRFRRRPGASLSLFPEA